MSSIAVAHEAGRRNPAWDFLLAAALALAALALNAAQGFPRLADSGGDNDSLLRLVQIRDLLAGQGWFDLHQYRMGPEGGFVMHWSRLVDAPIAALMLLSGALGAEQATAEQAALIIWPTLLLAAALWLILRAARSLAGDAAVMPAAILGWIALHFTGIFAPGAIDHHNVQLVLVLSALALLMAPASLATGLCAGLAAAAMIAIGMEAAPYVAALGLTVAARFWWIGREDSRLAAGFGLGLAGGSAAALAFTIRPENWLDTSCDAFSFPQAGSGLLAGLGIALVAMPAAQAGRRSRGMALVLLGVLVAGFAVAAFPSCLGDPFADLDPRLQRFWLQAITEAQPLWSMAVNRPADAAGYYATPALALLLLAATMLRGGVHRAPATVAALLAAAFLVSVWQVRGGMFSVPIAVVPLAGWIAHWRTRAAAGGMQATLRMVAAWLLSVNVLWSGAVDRVVGIAAPRAAAPAISDAGGSTCAAATDYAALARLPATNVLAVSNLGSAILAHTPHRALAGPYHRNVAGNLAALDAFMGTEADAQRVVRENRVGLIAICPGNAETQVLAAWAPGGFLVRIAHGEMPGWLEAVPGTEGGALRLYRVLPAP